MRIVITHSRTKRIITGSFELIGTREDLLCIGKQILEQCEGRGWVYGTVDILDTKQEPLPNQTPVSWDD